MSVTIIIPTYNERENILKIIPAICAQLPEAHILVVDDNSPDKTYEVVRELQKNMPKLSLLLRDKKEGLGKAYVEAFKKILQEGISDAVITMDADFAHDPKYLPELLNQSLEYDVVTGSRYVPGGGTPGWELWRRLLSKYGNLYAKTILGMPISDCTTGFHLIKTTYLRQIDFSTITMSGYAFLIELKFLLWRLGARFKEIPIVLQNRVEGKSKISSNIIREGIILPWKMKLRRK